MKKYANHCISTLFSFKRIFNHQLKNMNDQNKGELHNQDDVNPGAELDKIINEDTAEQQPRTDGTGANKPVHTAESLIINDELKERLHDEPNSLGVDLDGTNPGSNSHPMDDN